MFELPLKFGKLLMAGANLAAAGEQASGCLSRSDDQRAFGGEQFAVAGDEGMASAGRLRKSQGGGEPIDEPGPTEKPLDQWRELRRSFDEAIGTAHDARFLAEVGAGWGVGAACRSVEAEEADAAGDAERLIVKPLEELPGGRDDDELSKLTECHVHQRRGVDVDVEQIGDDTADVAIGARRIALSGQQHLADAGVKSLEPLMELGEDIDPLAGPRDLAFELAMLFVDASHLAAERGEAFFRGADRALGLVGLGFGRGFLALVRSEIGGQFRFVLLQLVESQPALFALVVDRGELRFEHDQVAGEAGGGADGFDVCGAILVESGAYRREFCLRRVGFFRLGSIGDLGGGQLGRGGVEVGGGVAELAGSAAGPRAHRQELSSEAFDLALDVGAAGCLRCDSGFQGGDLGAGGGGAGLDLAAGACGGLLFQVELDRGGFKLGERGLLLGLTLLEVSQLGFAGGDLGRQRPPIDQTDLRAQQLQPRGALAVFAGLSGLASGRCGAGFRLRRRCRKAAAGSARRVPAGGRRRPS